MDRQFEELSTKEILDTSGLADMLLDAEEERDAKNQTVKLILQLQFAEIRQM